MSKERKQSTEAAVWEIRRRTRRKFFPEEKIRIVLEGLLRDNRIDVHQSPGSRDYHVEGTAELTL